MLKGLNLLVVALLAPLIMLPQREVVDQVIGVVGKYPVLLSDLQNGLIERDRQGLPANRCQVFEQLVYQKLLVAQADRDSVTVSDQEVDTELNRRMAYFINQFGSEEKLEEFYGKRTNVLKDELRSDVQDQLLADKMEGRIAGDIKLTPAEVRQFFAAMPEDSLPLIESEVELQQLVRKPQFSAEAKKEAREKLESYRQRILNGQSSFSTLARLYSDDPVSASQGGLMSNVARGMMVPEFEAVAYRLRKGEISNVFETVYGYHIMELVQRKGELLDVRHILVMPRMSNEDFYRSKQQLDSIYMAIKEGSISFEEAVKKFSEDRDTRESNGLMINPHTSSTRWDQESLRILDPEKNDKLIVAINGMQPGDISSPMQFLGNDAKPGFRIIRLKNRIDPHRANLKDDYQKIMQMATADKRRQIISDWIRQRSKITYIKLDPQYQCAFENAWTLSQ